MAIEPEVIEKPAEEEYRKPNPQDNPRNAILADIAKSSAAKHAEDAAETAPSVDEEGNITPPAEAPQDAAALPAEAPVEAAHSSEPAPSAATAATLDPEAFYTVKVDGQEVKVPGKAIIDAGFRTFQKETAADFRLQMASQLLKEAEGRARAAPGPAPQPAPAAKTEPSDADLAQALQFGSPDQAAAALAVLRGKGTVTPEQVSQFAAQHSRSAVKDEFAFQEASRFVQDEYGDLLGNDYLRRLFFAEENRRRAPRAQGGEGDARPYRDLYKSIGDDLRVAFKMTKPASTAPGQATPSGTPAARQALKQATTVPRTAATRLQEAASAAKVPSASDIIAGMAAKRGKAQLTTLKKGA